MDNEMRNDKVVDAREILCPGPFWELIKAYGSARPNQVISLYATESLDADTKKDAPNWINLTGNKLLGVYDRDGYYEIRMEKTKIPSRN